MTDRTIDCPSVQVLPREERCPPAPADLVARFIELADTVYATGMFTGTGAVDTFNWLNDLVNAIDDRLGQLEKRLDQAAIPPADIPDDEAARYFTLPMLG